MLHELSLERTRLKAEQTKLERMSAGLMIDLQSTLRFSDDHVVVPAPTGSLARVDSDASLSLSTSTHRRQTSVDDLEVSARSKTALTPPRSGARASASSVASAPEARQPREVRMAKSHSPGSTPPSPGGSPRPARPTATPRRRPSSGRALPSPTG